MSNLKAGATADRSRDNSQLILDFDDNLLLSELFGAHDTNLVRIEETSKLLGSSTINTYICEPTLKSQSHQR